jgi:hypothetical protein
VRRYPGIVISTLIVLMVVVACTGGKGIRGAQSGKGESVSFSIKPSGQHEECYDLKPGIVMEYEFETSDFVNFNIHYHAGNKLKLPVHKKGVLMDEGTVDPSKHTYYSSDTPSYCLMWINSNEEVVKGSFRVNLKKAGGKK